MQTITCTYRITLQVGRFWICRKNQQDSHFSSLMISFSHIVFDRGRDSSVSIATGYGLERPGIDSRWGLRFSALVQTGPGAHPASCTMCTGSFPGVKSGRGVTLTPHPLLVPWSWKGRDISLLPLWVVRPVQSLSACTRVTFTFTFLLLPSTCFEQLSVYHKEDLYMQL